MGLLKKLKRRTVLRVGRLYICRRVAVDARFADDPAAVRSAGQGRATRALPDFDAFQHDFGIVELWQTCGAPDSLPQERPGQLRP